MRPSPIVPAFFSLALAVVASLAAPGTDASDSRATALAEAALAAMGGRENWERTRFLRWRFPGGRLHHWDRWTGDVRIETEDRLVLMNVDSRKGRAWEGGVELMEPDALREALETGYAWWVNDTYWLVMPYKLLDPGAVLRYAGSDPLPDGRPAERIEVTFRDGTGLTPRNKYDVWFAADTKLVEQWSYYPDANDGEPKFTLPWSEWKPFGRILLATSRGRGGDWEISAPESLPRSVFTEP